MDLKAGADSVAALASALNVDSYRNAIIAVAIIAVVLYALRSNGFLARLWKTIEETAFNNWQLALLGAAAILLSLASGWRTWDGMVNFTGDPFLSLMITFGVQSVLLIVAWLIGESFATGMSQRSDGSKVRWKAADSAIGMVLGLAIVGVVFYWLLHQFGAVSWTRTSDLAFDWTRFSSVATYFTILLLVLGVVAFSFSRGGDIAVPYVQGARIIARNAVLWVMFLACMGTSVFFSFDSFFSSIFPFEERKRAAELRAQNQVSGIMADIGATITTRRLSEAGQLFLSDGWKAYDSQLSSLARHASDASGEIERYFLQQMEERRRGIATQQERMTTAQSSQVALQSKKTSLTEELGRIRSERPGLAAEFAQHKGELDAKEKEIDAKRVEAMAEDRGVEGTGKQGRGPVYRERMAELAKLRDEHKIREERTRDAQRRLQTVESRITQVERELTTIDGDLAKLKGEADTAQQRIRLASDTTSGDDGPRVDPSRMVPTFERARADFRQEPTVERLTGVQQICTQLVSAMASTPATQTQARSIDCDPKQASEAAAVVFGLNTGLRTFEAECAGGNRLSQYQTADELFGFARKCLSDSGLPSRDTDELRTKINFLELNRDDKAHRFVVNWNAFQDGNRLAYLSLAIAIGLDSLIFLAGLFGANAVRSPLSDVPSSKGRTAQQLEAIIDTALMPHRLETARFVLGAMRPITPTDGFTAEVIIHEDDPHAADLSRVMNAGATIGAVRQPVPGLPRYEVRSELFEYLSVVSKREFDANKQHATIADMERTITVALLPEIGVNADIVLSHLQPIREEAGFMAEVKMDEVPSSDLRTVRSALNAGATFQRVQRASPDGQHYFVHGDFYRVLARIRGRMLSSVSSHPSISGPEQHGGALAAHDARISQSRGYAQITDGTQFAGNDHTHVPEPTLRDVILDDLLQAIDMDVETYQRVTSEPVATAAAAAGQALFRQSMRNRHLNEYLKLAQASLLSEVERAANDLREHYAHDAVTEVETEIKGNIRSLILCPQSSVLSDLIAQLRSAAAPDGSLGPGEQPLLDWLVRLEKAMRVADLSEPAGWQQVQAMIDRGGPQDVAPPVSGQST